ncbi:hypothetical protein F444_16487 [Phytophthora nicotianae P1976]|uniref:HAT C-terminal dimerisation domain-containing protein n=1 Tax=Phytophthora nicotianae P1976 TaxID=1317066 RepID=A0A080ZI99_PHYNI|nr:hypothetical protein F444_16487 [Phytophthora nicotianae P1976]
MSSSMRVAYLLGQTTDITKFANANDPSEEGDLALAMRELVDMAKGDATDPDTVHKYEAAVEAWACQRFSLAERGIAPSTIPMSPSSYWKIHGRALFPLSKQVADMIFSIPTSSASSERCWSVHDFIHSKRRNRLHASRVEKLVFVYSNLASRTGEPIRDHLADDMFPDAHDGDMDVRDGDDDEDLVNNEDDIGGNSMADIDM